MAVQVGKGITLHPGDGLAALESLPDHSIDAVITDPPYGTTNCTWDYKIDLALWWDLIGRKLKPAGICAMFAASSFAYELRDSRVDWFRYELVWEKSNAVGFLDAKRRPLRAHEWILIFAREFKGSTYNPQKWASDRAHVGAVCTGKSATSIYHNFGTKVPWLDDGTRYPRSVLRFGSVRRAERRGHPTQKPIDLVNWLVLTYSNAGDVVADPYMGSGTAAEACILNGRRFIGCEREPGFFKTAVRRARDAVR